MRRAAVWQPDSAQPNNEPDGPARSHRGYIGISPWLLGFLFFMAFPILASLGLNHRLAHHSGA